MRATWTLLALLLASPALAQSGPGVSNNSNDFTGSGIIATDPVAQAYIAGPKPLAATTTRSTLSPTLHLAKFLASSTPTVCVTGDSTTTLNPNNLVPSDILYYNLTRRIREDNPNKAITFVNMAIGSQTWYSLNAVATSNWPSFYFNTALPWLPYIQAANCTSLYINLGINDANGFAPNMVQQALATIVGWGVAPAAWSAGAKAFGGVITDSNGRLEVVSVAGTSGGSAPSWATTAAGATTTDGTVTWQLLSTTAHVAAVPDVVLITNKNGNIQGAPPFNTTAEQVGTVAAASYTRTLALSGGSGLTITGLPPLGLIDIGRYFSEAVSGYDPVSQYFTNTIPASAPVSGITSFPYTLPQTGGDFDLSFTVSPGVGSSANNYVQVSTGTPGGGATPYSQTSVLLTSGGGNGVAIYVNNGDGFSGPGSQSSYTAGVWNNAAPNTIDITAKGDHLLVQVNGTIAMDMLTARFVNNFTPQVTLLNPPASPYMTLNYYSSSQPFARSPVVTNTQCYGANAGPNGGNGLNHDASQCINLIDAAVLDSTRFGP